MDILFKTYVKLAFIGVLLHSTTSMQAQEVQTFEMSSSSVQMVKTRLGSASLIQTPLEPIATHVGDPANWLIEKNDRFVSIKPITTGAKDTNLAIITRLGTLNFSLHPVTSNEVFDQMIRITRIVDDSKPLSIKVANTQETLSEIIVKEIRTSQNYYALKIAGSPLIRDVEQVTVLSENQKESYVTNLLQVFRFKESGHLILHFTLHNKTSEPILFDQRKSIVSVKEALFPPMAVSLGKSEIIANSTTENFIVLDGSNGLNPHNPFTIHLFP